MGVFRHPLVNPVGRSRRIQEWTLAPSGVPGDEWHLGQRPNGTLRIIFSANAVPAGLSLIVSPDRVEYGKASGNRTKRKRSVYVSGGRRRPLRLPTADGRSSLPLSMPTGRDEQALRGRQIETDALYRLLVDARDGHSGVLVLRGEPGVGKTALLQLLVKRAVGFRIARATGVESEMELAFAGVHQLCASLLNRLDHLPVPRPRCGKDRVWPGGGGRPGPLSGRSGRLEPPGGSGRSARAGVHRGRRPVARSRLRAGSRLRGAAAVGGEGRAGVRGTRA